MTEAECKVDASIKVRFPGHGEFWFLAGDDGTGPLAPQDHCDERGEIVDLGVALLADSYAHVCSDGIIRRYRQQIGTIADLQAIAEFVQ